MRAKSWTESVKKLSSVNRYSQATLAKNENVLEHTGMVSMIVLHICETAKGITNKEKLYALKKALLHDVEESVTGDIAMPSKYFSPDTLSSLKKMEASAADKIFKDSGMPHQFHLWDDAKTADGGNIVGFADTLTVLVKAHDEIYLRGNRSLIDLISDPHHLNVHRKLSLLENSYGTQQIFVEYRDYINGMLHQLESIE